ncbi:MAG: FAD-dependent oxidoreductase, partial [Pirellulales bacterium]
RHAVLVDRLSQWVFARPLRETESQPPNHAGSSVRLENNGVPSSLGTGSKTVSPPDRFYYQVVISASRELAGATRREIVACVIDDLVSVWPITRSAQLLGSYAVTEKEAVCTPRPGPDGMRPGQRTPIGNLMLAGDWTETGWPSTMESAVRSGYLAAEAVLEGVGTPARVLVADLPRNRLVRWLFGPEG